MSSEIAVWNSNITWSPPCEISGWYGVYGVRNSERLVIASTIERHVVVVHARAEEADLGVGVPVARGQRGQLLVHLLLRRPAGRSMSRPRLTLAGMSAKRSSSEPAPMAPSMAFRSSSVMEV